MTKLEKAVRKIIVDCLSLKQNESLLILIDENYRDLGHLFLKTTLRVTDHVALVEIGKLKKDHCDPSPIIRNMMCHVDANIILTSTSLCQTKTVQTACHHGSRVISLSKLTHEIIERSINTDFHFISEKSKRLADLLSIGKTLTVVSSAGTNISLSINKRKGIVNTGIVREAGVFANLPAGVAYVVPENVLTEGAVVVDGSLGPLGLAYNPVELKIKNGVITKIIGGDEANFLRKALKPYGKQARKISEIGIGTNPKAKITGKSFEDKMVLGTVYITVGTSHLLEGKIEESCQVDLILNNPTLQIDGRPIIMSGQLLI